MAFTRTYQMGGSEYADCETCGKHKVYTYYGRWTPGVVLPTEGVHGADKLIFTNWTRLSAAEQAEAVSQIWVFDEDSQEWDPL